MNDVENKLVKVENNNDLMQRIADGSYTDEDARILTEESKSVNQMKLFLLAQAKRELYRVIKLTEFMNRIEEKYQERVMEEIDNIPLKDFPTIISTISSCLSRSNDIVQRVLRDDSLKNLVIIDNSVNTTNNTIGTSNQLNLDTPDARDRVNKIVRNVINVIQTYEDSEGGEDIDS